MYVNSGYLFNSRVPFKENKKALRILSTSRNMSTSWFTRCFRDIVGVPPLKYILDQRMRNAQILLETSDSTITEIAHTLGYENPMYFSRVFRKAKGLSPSKYRKTYRGKLPDPS